jgi:hypothetical protein
MVSSLPVTGPPYDQVVTSLARTERAALADLLDQLGPDEPTLCGDWTTRDLAAHLTVRERRPDALPGVAIKAFAGRTESVQDSYAERDYSELVQLVRSGPGRLSLFSLLAPTSSSTPPSTSCTTRTSSGRKRGGSRAHSHDGCKTRSGRRSRRVPRCPTEGWGQHRAPPHRPPEVPPLVASSGGSAATIAGEPLELLLYSFGRREHAKVTITGDTSAMTALRGADLSV